MSDDNSNFLSEEDRREKELLAKQEAADKLVEDGKQHYAFGHYEEATKCYENALLLVPDHAMALHFLGRGPKPKPAPKPSSTKPESSQWQISTQATTTPQTHAPVGKVISDPSLNWAEKRRRKRKAKSLDAVDVSKKTFAGGFFIVLAAICSGIHVYGIIYTGEMLGPAILYAVSTAFALIFGIRMFVFYGKRKFIFFVSATAISISSIITMIFIILAIIASFIAGDLGDDMFYLSLMGAGIALLGLIYLMPTWSRIILNGYGRIKRTVVSQSSYSTTERHELLRE